MSGSPRRRPRTPQWPSEHPNDCRKYAMMDQLAASGAPENNFWCSRAPSNSFWNHPGSILGAVPDRIETFQIASKMILEPFALSAGALAKGPRSFQHDVCVAFFIALARLQRDLDRHSCSRLWLPTRGSQLQILFDAPLLLN